MNARLFLLVLLMLGAGGAACAQEMGDAIYRDGAFEVVGTWGGLSFVWHAGLLYHYDGRSNEQYVIHATGDLDDSVKVERFTQDFVGGDRFLGWRTEKSWSWGDLDWTIPPSKSTRYAIIDHALDQLHAYYWNFTTEWKRPNAYIFGYFIPGNFRCDGLVEYCYEKVGLDINYDPIAFSGGPMVQILSMDDCVRDWPVATMVSPAASNSTPASALIQPWGGIMLHASASDGWSDPAYRDPLTFYGQVYKDGAWGGPFLIGKGSMLQYFTMSEVGGLYRFYCAAYDNAGNIGISDSRYVLYDPPTGHLQVSLEPLAARQAGAAWRVDGGAWLPSGTSVVVRSGFRSVEFKAVTNWTAPSAKALLVPEDATATYTGTYSVALGAVQAFIQPAGAVAEGAAWNVDYGPWRTSGSIESNLPAGALVRVAYQSTTNWDAAATNILTVVGDAAVVVTGTFTHATGGLRTFLDPPAVTNTALWRFVTASSTSAWFGSGVTLQGYDSALTGSVQFNAVAGWSSPSNLPVTIVRGVTTNTATYLQHGSAQVFLQPSEAVADGARWTVTGVTQNWYTSGAVVTGLSFGAATVYYLPSAQMSNTWWLAPSNEAMTIPAGGMMTATGRYAATRGAVRVTLGPDGAIASGAMWQLSGYQPGVWRTNNQIVVGVPTGMQALAFASVTGWTAPAPFSVRMNAGAETLTNAIYVKTYYPALYVATNGGHAFPYTNWSMAATNLQAAIDTGGTNSVVWVSNGVYRTRTPVVIGTPLTVQAANPRMAILDGMHTGQCVMLTHTSACIAGFTVRNGMASHGGGILMTGGRVSNCLVTACTAVYYGGGVYLGRNCEIVDSTVASNVAQTNDAGGIYLDQGGSVDRCTVVSNLARKAGGAFVYWGGTVRNSLFAHNRAGHVYSLPENGDGGGVLFFLPGGLMENCTIVGNSAIQGGGAYRNAGGLIRNCIIYDNLADTSGSNYVGTGEGTFSSCVAPSLGTNAVAGPPLWIDAAAGDFRLQPSSPCLDAGTNQPWMSVARDLEGYPRQSETVADLGAYERSPQHLVWGGGSHSWPYLSWSTAATNVQAAVSAAGHADEVLLRSGIYAAVGDLAVDKRILVAGADPGAAAVVDGRGSNRCFLVTADAAISNLTLRNGRADSGAGVFATATGFVMRACVVASNTATSYGGGVFFAAAGGLVDRCRFTGNTATGSQGGAVYARTGCEVRNSLIVGNHADEGGGVQLCQGGLVESCTVVSNSARLTGGIRFYEGGAARNTIAYYNGEDIGWFLSPGTATWCCTPSFAGTGNITNAPQFSRYGDFHLAPSSVCLNRGVTQVWMAAAADLDGYPRVSAAGVDIGCFERSPVHYAAIGGSPQWPFGAWAEAATAVQPAVDAAEPGDTVVISNGTFAVSSSVTVAKAILVTGFGTASNTTLDADYKAQVAVLSAGAQLRRVTLRRGYAAAAPGGGLSIAGGAILSEAIVRDCTSENSAGGVWIEEGGLVERCVIINNESGRDGGGVALKGAGATLRRCWVGGNHAGTQGGGVAASGALVENSIVAANTAVGSAGGALLEDATLESCTVVDNTAPFAPGVEERTASVLRSIIVGNGTGSQNVPSGYGTWAENCTHPAVGITDIDEDPLFVNFGAGDYRLSLGSPCIDSARLEMVEDYYGQVRPLDGDADGEPLPDRGACEYLHATADSDRDGMYDQWETAKFGDATCGVAAADSDSDDVTNLAEFRADTDPWDSESCLCFVSAPAPTGAVVNLRWIGGAAAWQFLERATNWGESPVGWVDVYTNAPPTGITNHHADVAPPGLLIYRIRAHR